MGMVVLMLTASDNGEQGLTTILGGRLCFFEVEGSLVTLGFWLDLFEFLVVRLLGVLI